MPSSLPLTMSMFACAADMQEAMHAEFEAWWDRNFAPPAVRNEDGTYTRSAANHAWEAFRLLMTQGITPDDFPGFCIAGPQCRCKGLELEQRKSCEEWANG
jgi:hypothetical protein